MANFFVYGTKNSTLAGLTIEKRPAPKVPERRKTVYRVAGRDDDLYEDEGVYNNVILPYQVGCNNIDAHMDYIKSMVTQNGYNKLVDTYNSDVYRRAFVNNPVEFTEDLMNFGHATIEFSADPYFYFDSGDRTISLIKAGTTLTNPAPGYIAKPLFVANGTAGSTITMHIENRTYTFRIPTGKTSITIDCLNETAYSGSMNACAFLDFDEFPYLDAKSSILITYSNGTGTSIKPRWRKL